MTHNRRSIVALLWVVLVIGGLPVLALAQAPAQTPAALPGGGVFLIAGLKATPGCLGVETARTASGKQAIFAWFENKKAVLAWYESDTHRQAMAMFPSTRSPQAPPPLALVPDEGPILVIASLKMADAPASFDSAQGRPGALPFAQISIELYRPLSGGIALGGRFAPDALKVPGLREIGVLAK